MYTSQFWPKYKKINSRAIFVLLYMVRPNYKKINYRVIFVLLYMARRKLKKLKKL